MLDIINTLTDAGIRVFVEQGKLKTKAVKGSLTPPMVSLIRDNRDELIRYLSSTLVTDVAAMTMRPRITVKNNKGSSNPLSYSQQRLWFIDRMEGGTAAYNIPQTVVLDEGFDVGVAERAFNRIVQRHEILRTVYLEQTQALQSVVEGVEFKLRRYDLTHLPVEQQQIQANQIIVQEHSSVFDLSRDLMIRGVWLAMKDQQSNRHSILAFTVHHIAADGWSMDILSREFKLLYQAFLQGNEDPLPPLQIQYADYALWQRQWLAEQGLQRQLDYWKKQLEDVPSEHALLLDFERPEVQSYQGSVLTQHLPAKFCVELSGLAKTNQITPFMLLHGLFALLLARHSNCSDIVVGTPVAGRQQGELEPLIGFFINTLVLRLNTEQETVSDYLEHVKTVNLAAQDHQDVPFDLLVEQLNLVRSTRHTPLFQIMFSLNLNNTASDLEGVDFSDDVTAKFDLSLHIELGNKGGFLSWEYDKHLFCRKRIEMFNQHLCRLAQAMVESPSSTLKSLAMMSLAQRQSLLLPKASITAATTDRIHRRFERLAQSHGEHIAVVQGTRQLSYDELNRRANRLAHYLLTKGIAKQERVGICMTRSINVVVAVLAVLKADAAYLPLAPDYPLQRLQWMVQDSGLSWILSDETTKTLLADSGQIINLDAAESIATLSCVSDDNFPHDDENDSALAYVIYTSGSTGLPKGVMIEHAQWQSYLDAAIALYDVGLTPSVLQFSSISFDIFIEELSLSVLSGGTLVIQPTQNVPVVHEFWALLREYQISIVSLPTAYWHQLCADEAFGQNLASSFLQLVITGGEALQQVGVDYWRKDPTTKVRLFNTYGPTEATVIATAFEISSDRLCASTIPIGRALGNSSILLLDKHQQLVPPGCVGELYIGGFGVARGYLNRSELSAEAFIEDPFDLPGNGRLYRTGDLARLGSDGNIIFIGRADNQVKIRGHRVELGEIERQLNEYHEITSALVMAREREQNDKFLVAYFISTAIDGDQSALCARIREYLKGSLPGYMIPQILVNIERWPLTSNGKVDLKALPEPDPTALVEAYVPPSNELEQQLLLIWARVLHLKADSLSVTANFFELGGNSILTVNLTTLINRQLGCKLLIVHFFQYQSIRSLAKYIADEDNRKRPPTLVPLREQGDGKVVFMVPGMGGSSHIFYPLATKLKLGHPVFGLDALGMNGDVSPHRSIEEIARYNIALVQSVAPNRCCILIGHSMGATVAFEMAKLLQHNSNRPSTLILIDGSPCLSGDNPTSEPVVDHINADGQWVIAANVAKILAVQTRIKYQPDPQQVEQIVAIQANDNESVLNQQWQPYSVAEVDHYVVDGDHFSMLKSPNVEAIANIVNKVIAN